MNFDPPVFNDGKPVEIGCYVKGLRSKVCGYFVSNDNHWIIYDENGCKIEGDGHVERADLAADMKPVSVNDVLCLTESDNGWLWSVKSVENGRITVESNGWTIISADPSKFVHKKRKPILDAEGALIEVGDVLYKNDKPWTVIDISDNKMSMQHDHWFLDDCDPLEYTHRKPDNWKELRADFNDIVDYMFEEDNKYYHEIQHIFDRFTALLDKEKKC